MCSTVQRIKRNAISRLILLQGATTGKRSMNCVPVIVGAVLVLRNTTTGGHLCVETDPIILESLSFPGPVIFGAVEPKTKGDMEKLSKALQSRLRRGPLNLPRIPLTAGNNQNGESAGNGRASPGEILVESHAQGFNGRSQTSRSSGFLSAKPIRAAPKARQILPDRPVKGPNTAMS